MRNTEKTTKEMIEVMQAFVDGKEVLIVAGDGTKIPATNPTWDWVHYDYDIAPESIEDTLSQRVSELEIEVRRLLRTTVRRRQIKQTRMVNL